jgi:hypothetical protein
MSGELPADAVHECAEQRTEYNQVDRTARSDPRCSISVRFRSEMFNFSVRFIGASKQLSMLQTVIDSTDRTGDFLDTDNYRKRVLKRRVEILGLSNLTFWIIRGQLEH